MSGEFRAAGSLPMGALFDNHDGYRPEASEVLVGRTLTLEGDDRTLRVTFRDADTLDTEVGPLPYEALAVRDGIVAVIARVSEGRSAIAVLDLAGDRVIAAVTELTPNDVEADEETRFLQAGIDGPLRAPFEQTNELVGKRIMWRYSTTHAFEHIYLNPTSYCWHGIEGPEQWVGDVDPSVTHKLADDLYLFSWSELAKPFNGAVILDLHAMLSYGRFFAWDEALNAPSALVVGARGTLLNETRYDVE